MTATLLQQEMFVPEPQRRLIVRRGMTAHWGVDPGLQRVAIAAGTRVARHSFPLVDGLARLSAIYAGVEQFAADLMDEWGTPGFVLVEQPSGQNVEPILWYAVGVTICAIQDAIEARAGSVRAETIPPSSWKKLAVGYGALYKPTKKKLGRSPVFEDYGVAKWARENGYTGSSWDEADALGIAEAARRLVTLEER
jgi:hypothetical protein